MNAPVLAVRDLRVAYRSPEGDVKAVDGVDLDVAAGEIVALAGESGCGKTTLALAIGGLLPEAAARYVGGSIRFEGRELIGAAPERLQAVRGGGIGYVFQEPASSFNPVLTIGSQIAEVLACHQHLRGTEAQRETAALLERVGIADAELRSRQYPHQLSGGLLQRAMIAMALAGRPRLLIADEPTSALDVTIQSQIVELLQRLRAELGLAVLFVSHDLHLVFQIADRLGVMYAGRLVEVGAAREIGDRPMHPYTKGLINGLLVARPPRAPLPTIAGEPPSLAAGPAGCAFHPRCALAEPVCAREEQTEQSIGGGHRFRCWKTVPATNGRDKGEHHRDADSR